MADHIDALPGWRRAYDALVAGGLEFGTVVPGAWLDEQFGVSITPRMPFEDAKRQELRRLRATTDLADALLQNHLRYLMRVEGTPDYRIARPEEQISHGMRRFRKEVAREYRRAVQTIVNVETTALTDAQRGRHQELITRMQEARSLALREQRATSRLANLPPPTPQEEP